MLFPRISQGETVTACQRVLEALARLDKTAHPHCIPLTGSAGIAAIAASVDKSVGKADHALSLARAKGGNRLEVFGSSFGQTGGLKSAG